MKLVLTLLAILVVVNFSWNITLYLSPDKETSSNYLFNVGYSMFYLLGSGVALWGVYKQKLSTTFGKSLAYYSAALLGYFAALILWSFYNVILHTPVPYPGIPDIFFILFHLLSAVGLIYLVKSYGSSFTKHAVVELIILFGVLFALLYSFLNQSDVGVGLPWLTKLLDIMYPALDALTASLAIIAIRTEKGSLHPNLLLFSFAALFMAGADTIFSYRSALEIYWNGDISDTLYMLSAILFVIAISINVFKTKPIESGS